MSVSIDRLKIVQMYENENLNDVRWSQRFLEKVARDEGLKHCQCVVYTNDANYYKRRCRIVANFFGLIVMIMMPVDDEARYSLELKIMEFLRRIGNHDPEILHMVEAEADLARRRLDRQKRRAKLALKRKRGGHG